jgi:hypothetical protein
MSSSKLAVRLMATAIATTFVALCLATSSFAQQYRTDPVDEKAKRHGAKATQWARDSAAYAADKANFDEYFQKYYFPAMTRDTPNGLAELGKFRVDLVKKLLWDSSNEALKRDLTAMAFKAMGRIVSLDSPPYHPAVRYNAILVIGMLDDQYAIDGANGRPPKPHAGANNALTKIIAISAAGDRFPPPVTLGALIGLERHAKYHAGLAPDAVANMSAALVKFLNRDKPIQNLDRDAQAWLRLRAASALANLGSVGPNNAAHDAIIKLIADSKSLDDRCLAASLLGKLNYKEAKIDAPATTAALFKLARDLGEAEFKRAEDFERSGDSGVVSERLVISDPDEATDSYPREHLLARLVNLRAGLAAVKPAVPEDSQKQIDAVVAAMKPVVEAASDKKVISLRVADLVRTMNADIGRLVGADEEASEAEEEFTAGGAAAAEPAAPGAPPPAGAESSAGEAPAATLPAAEEPAATPPAAQPDAAKN